LPKTASSKPFPTPNPGSDAGSGLIGGREAGERDEGSGPHELAIPRSAAGLRAWLPSYPWKHARSDLQAGLTVAAISLPQSMAYALIAGVDPRYGLFSAIVFATIASLFGSSSHLINGPTGAVSLVIFSTLSFFDPEARLDAYEGMFLLAVMIGVIQISIAVLKLGDLTRYISESVITGFLAGAATLTIVGQIGNALGLKSQGTGHQHVFYRLWLTLTQEAPLSWKAVAISGTAIALALWTRKLVRRYGLPQLDMFVVLLAVAVPAYLLGWSQFDSKGKAAISLIEEVPAALPGFHIPVIHWEWVGRLTSGAFAIGVLGLLETLAIAKAIAHKTGQSLDFNRQCLAEGLGNLVGGFFRCMPGAGSLSRSAINHQAGAATKMSGVYTAGIVALLVLVFAPLTRYIPKAALAGLLIVAAGRLIELPRIRYILRASRYDGLLLATTAVATLAVGVEFSIMLGVVVSALLFIPRAAKLNIRELVVTEERVVRERVPSDPPAKSVAIYDLEGELFFGAAPEIERHLGAAFDEARRRGIRHVVLRVKRVRAPDAVCFERLEHSLREAQSRGLTVLLAGIRPDLLHGIERLGWSEWLPRHHWFVERDTEFSATLDAVRKAYDLVGNGRQGEAAVYYLV
jgi:sulfate permease, SulP family